MRSKPPSPLFVTADSSRGTSHLFFYSLHILFVEKRKVSCTMLPSMVKFMALSELQMGDPSEALVPFTGSRHGVRWEPSSYSQAPIHIVVRLVRGLVHLFAINHVSNVC
jgi:hypothetical protein